MKLIPEKNKEYISLYSQYYSVVFSRIYSKVSNYDDATDICQEVFLRFYDKFSEIRKHFGWLIGTTDKVVLEFYKRKYSSESELEAEIKYYNGFKEARIIIQEALETIDDESRSVFELVTMFDYSYNEASKQLGLSKMQVRYRYEQTANKMLSYLKQKGIKGIKDLI